MRQERQPSRRLRAIGKQLFSASKPGPGPITESDVSIRTAEIEEPMALLAADIDHSNHPCHLLPQGDLWSLGRRLQATFTSSQPLELGIKFRLRSAGLRTIDAEVPSDDVIKPSQVPKIASAAAVEPTIGRSGRSGFVFESGKEGSELFQRLLWARAEMGASHARVVQALPPAMTQSEVATFARHGWHYG